MQIKFSIVVFVAIQSLLVAGLDLETQCENKFKNVDTVKQMVDLVIELRDYRSDLGQNKASKNIARCLDEFDSIDELGNLLSYTGDVCHPSHTEKILAYHRAHISHSKSVDHQGFFKKNKRAIRGFFRRYALHVSHLCRQNALDNLRQVSGEFSAEQWNQVFTWRNGTKSVEPNTELDIASESNDEDENVTALKLVEFINTIDKLTHALFIGQDEFTSSPRTSLSFEEQELNVKLGVKVPDNDKIESMMAQCDKFAVYYEGQILSIVRLANAGYRWYGSKLHEMNNASAADRKLMADWVRVSMMCFSMRKFKESLKIVDSPIAYHDFKLNHLKFEDSLIAEKDISASAMSKLDYEFSQTARKVFRVEGKIAGKLAKKLSNNKKMSEFIEKYKNYLEVQSGDRASKATNTNTKKYILYFCSVIIVLIIFGAAGFLGYWGATGHFG